MPEVTAYGGYGCAGCSAVAPQMFPSAALPKSPLYGGEHLRQASAGYDARSKGDSTITISDTAQVTAYGGPGASGIGQGSVSSTVNLYIADTATVNAYSDGTKAAITGIPQSGSTNILNIYMQNVELPGLCERVASTSHSWYSDSLYCCRISGCWHQFCRW